MTNAVMYMIPIIVGMSVMPDILEWKDGSFVKQARAAPPRALRRGAAVRGREIAV